MYMKAKLDRRGTERRVFTLLRFDEMFRKQGARKRW